MKADSSSHVLKVRIDECKTFINTLKSIQQHYNTLPSLIFNVDETTFDEKTRENAMCIWVDDNLDQPQPPPPLLSNQINDSRHFTCVPLISADGESEKPAILIPNNANIKPNNDEERILSSKIHIFKTAKGWTTHDAFLQ